MPDVFLAPHLHQMTDSITEPGYFLGDPAGFGPDGLLDLGALPPSGLAYLDRAPPAATALRNDLGSNISVLKTLNLRFRCFLAKVHELERRNRVLEKQLQQVLEDHCGHDGRQRPLTKETGVQTGFIGPIPAGPGLLPLSPTMNPPPGYDRHLLLGNNRNLIPASTDSNSNLTPSGLSFRPARSPADASRTSANINERSRSLPGTTWSLSTSSREPCITGPGGSWTRSDGVGVQTDTITPEIRAMQNVLAKVKREREEYKRRWEAESEARMDLQEEAAELEEELQESEACQEELTGGAKRLKEELVLFKGLVSNDLSQLDSRIQEKAMKVDMDICRRIDITARLCDVAQQRNRQDTIHSFHFQVATPPSTLSRRRSGQSAKGGDVDEPAGSESEGGGAKAEEACGTSANRINEQMQRMLSQLRECEFDDDCDSLAWEETGETLLLWEEFPGAPPGDRSQEEEEEEEEEESVEEVIKDTESLFQSREKEYQDTIYQIEMELATAKSDMNRHLHEYTEMCSMKRGLDIQMETCRRLITHSGDRKPVSINTPTAASESSGGSFCAAAAAIPPLTWRRP